MDSLLLLIWIFSPIISLLAISFMKRDRKNLHQVATVLSALPLAVGSIITIAYLTGKDLADYHVSANWFQFGAFEMDGPLYTVNFDVGLNGFTFILMMLVAVLSFLSVVAAKNIMKEQKGFFQLLFLLHFGMLGVFAAQNLILFFIFFELTLAPMFFLVSKWGYFESEKAAYRFLVYNGLGSLFLLAGIVFLFARTGTTDIATLQKLLTAPEEINAALQSTFMTPVTNEQSYFIMALLIIGFAVKLPIVPLHSWMVSVHREAPIPVVMLHAGILLKIGAYGMVQFVIGFFPQQFADISMLIIILGLINLLYGAWIALVQTELKLILAYSSISHMGIVLLGLGALNVEGMQGAIFQVVSHGFIAALLFYLVGLIEDRFKTTSLHQLKGIAAATPRLAGTLLIAGMASLGLPGLSGFVSEFQAFLGLADVSLTATFIGTIGLILTGVYVLRAVLSITFGKPDVVFEKIADVTGREWLPIIVMLIFIIAIGVYPILLSHPLQESFIWMNNGFGG